MTISDDDTGIEPRQPGPHRASGLVAAGLRKLADIVVPPVCLVCQRPLGSHDCLCPACWRQIRFIRPPLCDRLGIPMPFDTGAPMISGAALQSPPDWDRARAVAPGEVVLVTVRSRLPVQEVEGRWLDGTIYFYKADDGSWHGLAPIDLGVRSGRYTLAVTARTEDGRALSRDYAIAVAARAFPVRRLTVAPDFANPPAEAMERIQREQADVESIFATRSPARLWSAPFTVPAMISSTLLASYLAKWTLTRSSTICRLRCCTTAMSVTIVPARMPNSGCRAA